MNRHYFLPIVLPGFSLFIVDTGYAKKYSATPLINARFEKRTIPYYLQTKNKKLIKGFKASAKNWTKTKVVKLQLTNKNSKNIPHIIDKSVYKRFTPDAKASKNAFVGISNTNIYTYNSNAYTFCTDANYNTYYLSKRFYRDSVATFRKQNYSKKDATRFAKAEAKKYASSKMISQVLTHENGHDLGLADVYNNQKLIMHYQARA